MRVLGNKFDFVSERIYLELWRIKTYWKEVYRSTIICSKKYAMLTGRKEVIGDLLRKSTGFEPWKGFVSTSGTPC